MKKFLAIFMALLMFSSGYVTARGSHGRSVGNTHYGGGRHDHGWGGAGAVLAAGALTGGVIAGSGNSNAVVYGSGVEDEN